MWKRSLLVLLGLSALLAAQPSKDPDGAFAHPLHWSDPNGTAAGTRRSRCLPLTNDVIEAWKVTLPGPAASPIVYWEREAYLVCRKKDRFTLVAIDVVRGKLVAKKDLPKGPKPLPVVWDGRVYLRIGENGIGAFRRVGRTMNRLWVHKPGEFEVSDPIVFDSEIYVVADGRLLRLRPQFKSPVWASNRGGLRGRPALYGDHVYVLGDMAEPGYATSMHLFVYTRRDGNEVSVTNAAFYSGQTPPPQNVTGTITVTEGDVFIRGPAPLATTKGRATHVMLNRVQRDNRLAVGTLDARLTSMQVPPSVTPLGMLSLNSGRNLAWGLHEREVIRFISSKRDNPDLYDPKVRVAATVLGDIVYFGSWAADVRTRRILWRLPVSALSYPAVPMDGMVLVIDGATQLRAFRARGARE